MAWSGEHRAFIVEEFIRNGGSPVATQRAFRGYIGWPLRSPDLTPRDFFFWGYLKAKVNEQLPLPLGKSEEGDTTGSCCHYTRNDSQGHGQLPREATSVYQYSRPPLE